MKPKLKIPIARLGAWHHPQYGIVKFDQNDFNSLITNFKNNVRGYEPYLRYGHSVKGPGLHDGEPAIAHMVEIYQLSDVLWGVFEPNTDEVVDEIKRGAYRYATAEIIRKAKDKKTGKPLGPFLKGHALTNTPFVPDLPRNVVEESATLAEVLSDEGEIEYVLSDLMEIPAHMMTCTNCGEERETYNEQGLCETCQTAVTEALEPRQKPELTMMQKLLQKFDQMLNRIEMLPWEIMDRLSSPETAELYSDKDGQKVVTEGEPEQQVADETPADQPAEESGEGAPETPAEDSKTQDEPEEGEPSQKEPAAEQETAAPAPNTHEEIVDMEELQKLQAELEAAKAEKAELERQKAEAEAAQKAAEEAAEAARAELDAQAAATAQAEAERKEQEFAQMLSDRVTATVAKGVAPVKAQKAADLVKALRTSTDAVMLSEGADPVDVMDAVFELFSDVQDVNFEQEGAAAGTPASEENPYQAFIDAQRAKRAGK